MTYVADAVYKAGDVVQIGTLLGVNAFDVVTGQEGEIQFGVFDARKQSGVVIEKGTGVSWNNSTKTFSSGGNGSAYAYEGALSSEDTVLVAFTGIAGISGGGVAPSLSSVGDGSVTFAE